VCALVLVMMLLLVPGTAAFGDSLDGEVIASARNAAAETERNAVDWDAWEGELESEEVVGFHDPFESTNRRVFAFNRQLDRFFFDPVTRFYSFVTPSVVRQMVLRGFEHLASPPIMVNDVLQLEFRDAGIVIYRFVVNTTIGVAGLFDPASKIGLEKHHSDFGQTLALYGVESGPYLVLPAVGPTTTRDLFGSFVDIMFHPGTYLLAGIPQIVIATGTARAAQGIALREDNFESMQSLSDSSFDYYSTLHNAFTQDRLTRIWSRREHHRSESPV
jgi:phospholipid-binding lipoprotein MlaA